MMTQTTAQKAALRCPGCHSRAEREPGRLCIHCRQHELLLKLVVQVSQACKTIADAYAIAPHPGIAQLKNELVAIADKINKAAGVE